MDITKNGEVFSNFNGEMFNNFLDEEIPQDIFDDIMNDVNFNAIGFEMNSLSSDDSGRSSSSYEDQLLGSADGFFDQPMAEINNLSCEIKEEQVFSPPQPSENVVVSTIQSQPILIQQSFQSIQQPQQHLILQQPNIVVKHEPIKVQQVQPGQQQILTLQNIGGNLFTAVTQAPTPPVHTIVNGTTGILTKIPIVPMTRIQTSSGSISKPTAKDKKKSGHNIIERRYRTSINDKITELKNLVSFGTDSANAKMNKSGILKRSIDRIRYLESENADLRRENETLREMLNATANMETVETIPLLSPPHSNMSSPTPSSPSSVDSSTSSKGSTESEQKIIFIQHGISPHNKFAVCIFMFAIVVINNFGGFLLNDQSSDLFETSSTPIRRTILSAIIDDPYKTLFSWKSLLLTMVNMIILFACLIKLLVYGEPVVKKSKCAFKTLKMTAELDFGHGDFNASSAGYLRLLQQYGINLPTEANMTRLECFSYTVWQIIRMIMYRLPCGLWLARKVGGLFCPLETRTYALTLTKEIGWILHRLNQIQLIERRKQTNSELNSRQTLYGIMLSFYAINMCETAEQEMLPKEMSEVYLIAALRVKSTYWLKCLGGYYMRKAKSYHFLDTSQNKKFDCLLSEYGYKFIVNNASCDGLPRSDLFTTSSKPCEPISQLQQDYRQHLLEKAIESLLGLKSSTSSSAQNTAKNYEHPQVAEVLTFTKLLLESIDGNWLTEDNYISWLTHVLIVAAQWVTCDFDAAEELTETTRNFPTNLLTTNENDKTLLKALFATFMAKRELVKFNNGHSVTEAKLQLINNRCNVASCLLQKHLAYNRSQNPNVDNLTLLLQLLTCDWLLEIRTQCWELLRDLYVNDESANSSDDEGVCDNYYPHIVDLENFQRDLNSLQLIVDTKQMGQPRIVLYEAVYRLMAGATPLQTHQILTRNLLQTRNSKTNLICAGKGGHEDEQYVCGERERALSIYVACRYLPEQMGVERAGLLTQAAGIFKHIGDTTKMNECYRLITFNGSTGKTSKTE